MAIINRTMYQGQVDNLIVDCGDNSAIDATAGVKDRIILNGGESVSSATKSITRKPTGATDLTLGSVTVISSNTEGVDRIIETGEGFLIPCTVADDQALGEYVIEGEITTSASRTIPYCIHVTVVGC